MRQRTPLAWTPELETALLRQLQVEVRWVNQTHFSDRLAPISLRLTDTQVLGRFIARERTIELSRSLVLERPWGEVVEVLRHELAHQFVEEVLRVVDEPPHGPTFRRVCAERAIDARAAGRPQAALGDPKVAQLVEKVRRLLALAGSENEHEAELAMRRARELMLKHELSLEGTERSYVFRQLGTPKLRKNSAESIVGGLLAEHFFVQVIWTYAYQPYSARVERVLEVCGKRENVAMAEYVHGFLLQTAERLWHDARASRPSLRGHDRAAFLEGVVQGFRHKLREAGDERPKGEGLVWVGDPGLDSYFARRNPRVRKESRRATMGWAVRALGHQEGRKVVLHRPIEGGSGPRGPRGLLPR